jgi:hypothetical protein
LAAARALFFSEGESVFFGFPDGRFFFQGGTFFRAIAGPFSLLLLLFG